MSPRCVGYDSAGGSHGLDKPRRAEPGLRPRRRDSGRRLRWGTRAAAAGGGGEAAPPVDPARDARHHARRRDRPRGRGRPDAGLQRARGARASGSGRPTRPCPRRCRRTASMMTGLYPGGPRHPRERAATCRRASGARRAAARRPATHGGVRLGVRRSRGASASRAASSLRRRAAGAGRAERTRARHDRRGAGATCDAASAQPPLFLWVHYYDPHAPYEPPEPFRRRYAKAPYLGEVAAMDEQLGRLVRGVRAQRGGRSPSSSSATTARASATTASRSTATCSISPRCTCRS